MRWLAVVVEVGFVSSIAACGAYRSGSVEHTRDVAATAAANATGAALDPAAAAEASAAEREFRVHVDSYLAVRARAASTVPALNVAVDATQGAARQRKLAAAIRHERRNAKQGDVFTLAVVPHFRRVLKSDFKERDAAAFEEVPSSKLGVNDSYPGSAALATIPPLLLARLPMLPDVLSYRFLERRLVLLDVEAQLIVDFIAAPMRSPSA